MGAYPQIADWNEDGKLDLLVGDTNGRITLFINNGVAGNPQLTIKGFIPAGGSDLSVGNRASPVVVDWNNDKKKDLIVGTDNGNVRWYLNSGTNSEPLFTAYSNLKSGGVDIQTSNSASPEVCDLDGDGKKDLLVSDYTGYIYFYRNTGTDSDPKFSSKEKLVAGNSDMKTNSTYARIDVVDWDEDGDLDILAGEDYAYVNLFLNTSNPSAVADHQVEHPSEFWLAPNYPNPFNSATIIQYQLPKPAMVTLSVFDITGKLVKTLVHGHQMSGLHDLQWDAKGLCSGVYFIRFKAGDYSATQKCVIEK